MQDRVEATGQEINRQMRLDSVATLWLDEIVSTGKLSPQTVAQYTTDVRVSISPQLGGLRLHECTTSRLDTFLKAVAREHPAKARRLKVILSAVLGLAVRHDAMPTNPIREVAGIRGSKKVVRALDLDELKALREHVRLWEAGGAGPVVGRQRTGRPRVSGLLDVVDVLLATGARIGEVLAIRWSDIDLSATPPRLTISGTVVRLPGRQAEGGGLVRQAHTKSASGFRTVLIPKFAVETIMRLQIDAASNPWDVIFPSSIGTLRDPHNLRRQWRDARGDAFAWVTPHAFRKTVATLIDRERSEHDAAAQLGHSGSAVTRKHYIQKASSAPDLTHVLELLSDASTSHQDLGPG
ncbi:tyrosine-type recombinase/integrase [Rhodococcus sp. ARC_M12]|uniref:tyrosine-type recombinase/integrase n=1 Tax=Rhodococcus sp. ARC_M12 TaxID=2928854 RepID=UPI001FB3868E|nr:tyrosine-type recombinase/integrase [Rhodococcus sp. ARC_M12]MCJ0980937.1 tyrosine-type recombinase/integrase [Rhodococcus sp. ARC_M12]